LSNSESGTADLEQNMLALQEEVELLRTSNADLNERLKAYSSINIGQTSLINKLIDKVPFGVMLINEEHLIIQANGEAESIFSMTAAELEGLNCNDLFSTHIGDKKVLDKKLITRLENGKYVMHSAFVSDDGSGKLFVKSFVDISEVKIAEQELIKINQAKDEFLSLISHELRTPLNVIQGYTSLLGDEISKTENKDAISYIDHINDSGEKLLHLITRLLELTDLTAGKVKVDALPVSLDIIVTQLQYRLEKPLAAEGNELIFNCEDIPPFEQDLALLLKVLYELLSNANKFTEKGVISVSISIQDRNEKKYLCFEIADTGCGMPEKIMEQIFGAFQQADSSVSRAHDGLGLGLNLVEKSVKLLQGYIEVKSKIGKGSTFTLYVPYKEIE